MREQGRTTAGLHGQAVKFYLKPDNGKEFVQDGGT